MCNGQYFLKFQLIYIYMNTDLLPALILSFLCFIYLYAFFKHYGGFKLPWYASWSMIVTVYVSLLLSIALLPYDVSLFLFKSDSVRSQRLYELLSILYWSTWVLGWIVMPTIVSIYTFHFALTMKSRIWYAIKYNIMWYVWAIVFVLIGVVIMSSSKKFKVSDLIPLTIALSNAYGILLFCLLLGHGLVAFPRKMWNTADPAIQLRMRLRDLEEEVNSYADSLKNARIVERVCNRVINTAANAQNSIRETYREIFKENINPRLEKVQQILSHNLIKSEILNRDSTTESPYLELESIKWDQIYEHEIEEFLQKVDSVFDALNQSHCFMVYTAEKAEEALNSMKTLADGNCFTSTKVKLQRLMAIIFGVLSALCLWGEIALIFKPSYSLFHWLSHLRIGSFSNQLLVTGPVIVFLFYVGSWSLTRVRLWSYFRFIPGATNENTFYFWVVFISRLAPSVGYHYLLQIEGQNTMTISLMGVMKEVAFFGNNWNIYAPVIMLAFGLFVVLDLWNRILGCFGVKSFTFENYENGNYHYEIGKTVLFDMNPSLEQKWRALEERKNVEKELVGSFNI